MKKNVFNFLVLLPMLALVSCGNPDSISQSTNSTESSSTHQSSNTKDEVIFSIPESLNLLLGQELDLSQYISPTGTAFSIESSSTDNVTVNGTKIKAVGVTDDNSPVEITLTSGTVTVTSEVTVQSPKAYLEPLFAKSIELEKDNVTSASFSYINKDVVNNTTLSSSEYNYEFLKDKKLISEINGKTYFYSYLDENNIVRGEREDSGADFTILNIVDGETTGIKINKDEASNMFSLPRIKVSNSTNPLDSWGVSNYIWDAYFKTAEHFGEESIQNDIRFEVTDKSYSLSVYRFPYFNYGIRDELSFTFDDDGALTNFDGSTSYYQVTDKDSIPESDNGTEVKTETIHGEMTYGEKSDADDTFLNYQDYLYKSYDPYFALSGYGVSKDEVKEAKVGTTLDLKIRNQEPQTASNKLDRVYIEKIEGDGEATIKGSYKDMLEVTKEGTITVTTISTLSKIEKTLTLTITKDGYDKIVLDDRYSQLSGYYLPSTLVANQTYSFRTWYMNNSDTSIDTNNKTLPDITITVDGENTADLTLTKNTSYSNRYSLKATKAGTVTINIVDKTLGESKKLTKTLTVYEDTDEGIAQYLLNSTFRQSTGIFKDPVITLDANEKTKGKVELNTTDGDDNSKVTGDWYVENKKLKIKTPEDFEVAYVKTFSFYDYSGTTYYTNIKFEVGNFGGEENSGYFGVL